MINSSVPVGRDASLVCHVSESQGFKVAWVRVETQTILTMNEHVITRNHRIKVSNPEKAEWRLDIADVKRRDAGYYMCQVNTDPMKSQLGYLEVVGKILESIMIHSNNYLWCRATSNLGCRDE